MLNKAIGGQNLPLTLISSTPSPWARKVRIVMIEKSIPFDLKNDIPWAPQTMVPEYNPLEKLPILLTADGRSIYESRYIIEWLEKNFPEIPMIPQDNDAYLSCKKIEVLVDGTLDASLLLSFEVKREFPDHNWLNRQKRKVIGGIREIARLVGHQKYAVGTSFSLADAAVGTMLASFDFGVLQGLSSVEGDWRASYPHLIPYFDQISSRASFLATQPVMFDFDLSTR